MHYRTDLNQLVRLNFGLSMYLLV